MNPFKNLKMGTKLFAILVAPVIVLSVIAAISVSERFDAAADASRTEEMAEFARSNIQLMGELQLEALWSSVYMASDRAEGPAELAAQQAATDAALEEFLRQVDEVNPAAESDDLETTVSAALRRLESLSNLRVSVDQLQSNPVVAATAYASTVTELQDVNRAVSRSEDSPALARGLRTTSDLSVVREHVANLGSYGAVVMVSGDYLQWSTPRESVPCASGPDETVVDADVCDIYRNLGAQNSDLARATVSFDTGAAADLKFVRGDAQAGESFESNLSSLLATAESPEAAASIAELNSDADGWVEDTASILAALGEGEDFLITTVLDEASNEASSAGQAALIYLVLGVGAIVLALGIALLVSRATTVPLRKLTSAAYILSTERLPVLVERLRNPEQDTGESLAAVVTPIDIDSTDEIGQLADAFNSIQQVTVEVAEEQSQLLRKGIGDIFINLARRNQTLLDRQIEFIDQLESNEEDPDQLDNLFKLDHLATRMRRNAESLLVLAGAEPPRRRGRPVAIADVVRVAIGEVEDFARIQILALDEATVGGNVAVDLAHLLSELMENATHFSPPDTMVEVVGHSSDDGFMLSVTDQGIGMSADQLNEANTQLAKPPLVGLALSRSLGFIVIGRLAQRFGIQVKLTSSPSGGVSAVVTLPRDIVTIEGEETPSEPAPAAARAAAPEAVIEAEPTIVLDEEPAGDDLIDELFEAPELPADEEFDRGLQSLVSDDLPEAPVEPEVPAAPAAEPEPEPVVAEAPAVVEAPAEPEAEAAKPITAAGLVQRTPKKRDASHDGPDGSAPAPSVSSGQSQRSPEEIRKMLSRYRTGLNKGRDNADTKTTD